MIVPRRLPTAVASFINRQPARHGFTLVEMLVAMAITLLMMLALAKSFGFVSQQIRDSRADTDLANRLRDISTRLSDELSRCTVNLSPNNGEQDQRGYFLYYEGPSTDATSTLFRAINDADGNVVLDKSKFADFDDYIAFTAVAQGNNWFTGKVPRYLLDQKTAEVNGTTYTLPNPIDSAFEPVVIRSKYAEIIYFASPEYAPASLPANPAYIDVDGDLDLGSGSAIEDGIPDRIRIHRRVLLIRPDLNLAGGMLPIQNNGTVNFMQADAWPTATPATAANTTITTNAAAADAWLYGMAGVHGQCDLSVRRVLNATGAPTVRVAANALSDLSNPQNRFAHVRVPHRLLFNGSTANFPTSMPVLALGDAPTIFSTMTATPAPVRIAPPATPNAGPVVTPDSMSGFLRPEFILGYDYSHLNDATDAWGLQRVGEDLLTNNALGFNVQIYDPNASFFSTSNGLVVGPSDAGYREAVREALDAISAGQPPPPNPPVPIDSLITREIGGFVDLAYPVLAGGSLRGWQARRVDRRSNANTGPNGPIGTVGTFLITPFSGVANYTSGATGATSRTAYQQSLYNSGRLITDGNSISLFQPAFDTYTSFFERDGFYQGVTAATNRGTLWSTTTTTTGTITVDQAGDGLDNDQVYGADDPGERETLPPFRARPESIRVTIRVENPAVRLIRQASVVHRDQL